MRALSTVLLLAVVVAGCSGDQANATSREGSEQQPAPTSPLIDTQAFAPLYRSIKSVHGVVQAASGESARLGHVEYDALVDAAAAEFGLVSERTETDAAREIVALFKEVVQAYMDGNSVWKLRTLTSRILDEDIILYALLHQPPNWQAQIEMTKRNGLPLKYSTAGESSMVIPLDSVERIWKLAGAKFTAAESRYQEMVASDPASISGVAQ